MTNDDTTTTTTMFVQNLFGTRALDTQASLRFLHQQQPTRYIDG